MAKRIEALGLSSEAYRNLSFWHDTVPDDLSPRASMPGDRETQVAIIGGGLTGLWTVWYLLERDPELKIVVLEKEIIGFGASGRNGGWCSALFARSAVQLAAARDEVAEASRYGVDAIEFWNAPRVRAAGVPSARPSIPPAPASIQASSSAGWRAPSSGAASSLSSSPSIHPTTRPH